jgi:hypothetical protein
MDLMARLVLKISGDRKEYQWLLMYWRIRT